MKILSIVASIIIVMTAFSLPLSGQTWDEYREHEVLVFTGNSMSKFESAPIKHIFVFAYHKQDNSWHELTLQIDELDNKGYFEASYDSLVGLTDEFSIMVGEAGDYAPPSNWIDDEDSRRYGRLQFELINPDDPLQKKYVYIYRSSTFVHDPELPHYYIKYVTPTSGASDTVKAMTYLEGHNSKGIPEVWKIADSTGTYGFDLLDRQKARVKGKYKPVSFITISYNMSENDLNVDKFEYKRGPIRIIREITYKSEVSGYTINVGTFRYRYYPYHIVSLGASKQLESKYGVSLIRQSFDLDSTAIGMKFNNPYNFDVAIDGLDDQVNTTTQPSPVMNWYMYSGNFGTIAMLNEFTPPTSSTYSLYYQESLTGETADNTTDTGDKKSYSDVGIMFNGDKMVGGISLPYSAYFFPNVHSQDVGATLAYQSQNPVYIDVTYNPYSVALTVPDTSGLAQFPISIPVMIGNVDGLNILSSSLAIQFDPKVLQATGINVEQTLVETWDLTSVGITNDTIYVALQGATALEGSGVLVYLSFDVIGSEGQQSPLHFIYAKLNEWNPLALLTDGNFSALAAPKVPVSIADTTMKSGELLDIPVMISSLMDLELKSYSMNLSFNPAVLQFNGVDTKATIASNWESPIIQNNSGNLSITATGSTPLASAGALIYLNFKVIGSDGSSTAISFSTMTFNSGQYLADIKDGTVDVKGVVPVELSSFSANVVDKDVRLHWTTATESNNFGFFIHRTNDVNAEWQTIGFVSGKGTTTSPQTYVFVDTDVASRTWYYRLQQQDLDGHIFYSQTIEVQLLPTKFALYQNSPNPFNSSTLIKYDLPVGEHQVSLVIYDLLGHQITTLLDKENQPTGAYQLNWDARDDAGQTVASGVYFYRLQTGEQSFIKKMILIE